MSKSTAQYNRESSGHWARRRRIGSFSPTGTTWDPGLGIDSDPDKVVLLNSGFSYVREISHECIRELVSIDRLVATEDLSRADEAQTVLFCLSTPVVPDKAEVSYSIATFGSVARQAKPSSPFIVLSQLAANGARSGVSSGIPRDFVTTFGNEVEDRESKAQTKKPPYGGLTRTTPAPKKETELREQKFFAALDVRPNREPCWFHNIEFRD